MFSYKWMILIDFTALPRMLSGKESACNAGDVGLIRKTPRRQNCNPLQYSCLENPMDRGAWWATVHVVTKSWAWRRNSTCTHNASLVTFCYPHSVSSVQSLSHVQLFVTPWTVTHQVPLSMGFPRQEYWSGLQFSSPGDLPEQKIKLVSPAWQEGSLPHWATKEDFNLPYIYILCINNKLTAKMSTSPYD